MEDERREKIKRLVKEDGCEEDYGWIQLTTNF